LPPQYSKKTEKPRERKEQITGYRKQRRMSGELKSL
jgi:hypothetical protein